MAKKEQPQEGLTEQQLDDLIGNCFYDTRNNLATPTATVQQIRKAFKAAGYSSPQEVKDKLDEQVFELGKVALEACNERVGKEVEEARRETRDEWRQKCADLVTARHEISVKEERERFKKILNSFGVIKLKKALTADEFGALFE